MRSRKLPSRPELPRFSAWGCLFLMNKAAWAASWAAKSWPENRKDPLQVSHSQSSQLSLFAIELIQGKLLLEQFSAPQRGRKPTPHRPHVTSSKPPLTQQGTSSAKICNLSVICCIPAGFVIGAFDSICLINALPWVQLLLLQLLYYLPPLHWSDRSEGLEPCIGRASQEKRSTHLWSSKRNNSPCGETHMQSWYHFSIDQLYFPKRKSSGVAAQI